MKNIDVNGDTIVIAPNPNDLIDKVKQLLGFDTKYQVQVKNDLAQLKKDDKGVDQMITDLENCENIHNITMPNKKSKYVNTTIPEKKDYDISQGSTVYYNPYNKKRNIYDRETRTPRIGLAHELQHSWDVEKGIANKEMTSNGILIMDVRAVKTENKIRMSIGEPLRTFYGKKKINFD